jgi:hypothetical protein
VPRYSRRSNERFIHEVEEGPHLVLRVVLHQVLPPDHLASSGPISGPTSRPTSGPTSSDPTSFRS